MKMLHFTKPRHSMMSKINSYRMTGTLFLLFLILFLAGYFVLMSTFEFPDVLRMNTQYRFNLFHQNQRVIVPTYYVLTFTAILQVFMAIFIYHVSQSKALLDNIAVGAGIIAGIFKIIGFIRWVVLIPVLSSALNNNEVSTDIIFFIEKIANSYLGMGLGEHMSTLFLGIWIILINIRIYSVKIVTPPLSIIGIITGVLVMILSFEALEGIFSLLSDFTVFIWGLYYGWVGLMGISFLLKREDESAPQLHWSIWAITLILWLLNAIPSFL